MISYEATRRVRRMLLVAALPATLLATFAAPTMAIEEPAYRIVRTIEGAEGPVEVRDYAAYTVAEVEVSGSADAAGGQAFPILAGYIFGKNVGERRMSMTAPVVQTAAPVRLPMTAPIMQAVSATGHVVQFVLPAGITRDSAPEPLDARVRLRDVPARRYAVIRYAGFWSDANYAEHLGRLQAIVGANELRVIGEPVFARYDPPFKPWFMRRNEIWLPLAIP
jgi:hypothetical protein